MIILPWPSLRAIDSGTSTIFEWSCFSSLSLHEVLVLVAIFKTSRVERPGVDSMPPLQQWPARFHFQQQ
jgi:hypothetical protein